MQKLLLLLQMFQVYYYKALTHSGTRMPVLVLCQLDINIRLIKLHKTLDAGWTASPSTSYPLELGTYMEWSIYCGSGGTWCHPRLLPATYMMTEHWAGFTGVSKAGILPVICFPVSLDKHFLLLPCAAECLESTTTCFTIPLRHWSLHMYID